MVPENCYVNQQELEPFPCGIRIDYVLYKVRPLPPTCFHSLCLFISHQLVLTLCPARLNLISLMIREWDSQELVLWDKFLFGPYFS